jgi:hypothetical protein
VHPMWLSFRLFPLLKCCTRTCQQMDDYFMSQWCEETNEDLYYEQAWDRSCLHRDLSFNKHFVG